MRKLGYKDMEQRGCSECGDCVRKRKKGGWYCPHEECPYHELDGYESFTAYLKAHKNIFAKLLKKQ